MHNVNVKINKRANEYINNKVSRKKNAIPAKRNDTSGNKAGRQAPSIGFCLGFGKDEKNNKRQTSNNIKQLYTPHSPPHTHGQRRKHTRSIYLPYAIRNAFQRKVLIN